jgi:hypothetical protein
MSTIDTNATLAMDRTHAAGLVAGTPLRVTDLAPAHAGETCTLLNLPEWARANTPYVVAETDTKSTVLDSDGEMLVEFTGGTTGYVSIERLTLASDDEAVPAPSVDGHLEDLLVATPIAHANAIRSKVAGLRNDLDAAHAERAALQPVIDGLTAQRDEARSATRSAVDHLERVRLAMIEEAENRDWCADFDRFLDRLDLAPRERTEEVSLTVTLTVQVTVEREITWTGDDAARDSAVEEAIDNLDADTLVSEFSQWRDEASIDSADEVR